MPRIETQLPALTRIFSSAVFREMARKGRSALFRRLVDESELAQRCGRNATVGDAFNAAFEILKSVGRRDEYVYRAALTQKILLGTHSLRTASILNEFRVGECRADLVILNGTATVYEIKSERDSLARLSHQVENYRRVFASVNVITCDDHIEGTLAAIPDDVGVMQLTKRYRISSIREAKACTSRISPSAVFESLRSAEASQILTVMGHQVPNVPNTRRHALMREMFSNLKPDELHFQMVRTLKRTRTLTSLTTLIDQLPPSLHAAALSIPIRRLDHNRLVNATKTPLDVSAGWAQ